MDLVLYIHGKGGNAAESARYEPLFPGCQITGLAYRTDTPWEAGAEIREAVEKMRSRYTDITLIANSVGAFFSMHAGIDRTLRKAYFISPIVDMERLITDRLVWAGVTEEELRSRGVLRTSFGEDLSWDYLHWVREHPARWETPTQILYGGRDHLTPFETVAAFAAKHRAGLTVMEDGEHWFHTEEQMRFLDDWIRRH